MPVSATEIFASLKKNSARSIDRREVHCATFSLFRRSVRAIVTRLAEAEEPESQELSDGLRLVLSECLTAPIAFDDSLLEALEVFGDPTTIETRWGREVRAAFDTACVVSRTLQTIENPLRRELRELVSSLIARKASWRIYCTRKARAHFESCFADAPLPPNAFLHTVKDYREAEPFEILVRVGPLRSRGWGAVADAVMSAPRFDTLLQLIWPGCSDEEGFGYDPAAALASTSTNSRGDSADGRQSSHRAVSWITRVTQSGDPPYEAEPGVDIDEFALFQALGRTSEVRRAVLLQVDDEDGILYPPFSQVPTFDPAANDQEAIGHRLPGQTILEGMFVVWPLLGATDLGGVQATEGHYSKVWKERLREEFRRSPNALLRDLRSAGLEYRNLRASVREWCRAPTSVVHAPLQKRHFEILIQVLRIQHETSTTPTGRSLKHPWWQYAWSEISYSRGKASQAGMQEQEIIDEELFDILNGLLPDIRRKSSTHIFELELPANAPLTGSVRFYKVRAIEEGFLAPDNLLKVVCDLDAVEQWRA